LFRKDIEIKSLKENFELLEEDFKRLHKTNKQLKIDLENIEKEMEVAMLIDEVNDYEY